MILQMFRSSVNLLQVTSFGERDEADSSRYIEGPAPALISTAHAPPLAPGAIKMAPVHKADSTSMPWDTQW